MADNFTEAFAGRNSAAFFLNQFDRPGQLAGRAALNQSPRRLVLKLKFDPDAPAMALISPAKDVCA